MTKEQKEVLDRLPEGLKALAEKTWNFEKTFDEATQAMGLNDDSGLEDLFAGVAKAVVGQNPAKDIYLKGLKREKAIDKKYKEK